jgi:enterobacterial common antigen flippase
MATINQTHGPDSEFANTVRSTVLVGGGSFATMVIGILRTKFVAALIGPSGFALFALFNQLAEVVGAITSFGLGTSGVRQIAAANATHDPEKLARTVKTLRRTTWCTGALGCVLMLAGARLASIATFGDTTKTVAVSLLGIIVLTRALITGRTCIVQGTRRIKDLILINVGGAIVGLLTSVPCVYFWGSDGIVPGLVLGSVAALGVSWWFSRRIHVAPINHSWSDTRGQASELFRFGFPIMLMGLVGTLSPYLERVILLRTIGLRDLGQYQAAYALTGVLTSFVIAAMTADCYPKLVGYSDDASRLGKEVNAQIEASLLMSIPGVLWLFALSPLVVVALYSPEFLPAAAVLRITILGVIGRLVAWPLRLAFMAKGMGGTVLSIEIASAAVGLGLISLLTPRMGLRGAGWAFAAANLLLPLAQLGLLPRLVGIRVSSANLLRGGWGFLALGVLAANEAINPIAGLRWALATLVATVGALACARALSQRTGWNLRQLVDRVRGASPRESGL